MRLLDFHFVMVHCCVGTMCLRNVSYFRVSVSLYQVFLNVINIMNSLNCPSNTVYLLVLMYVWKSGRFCKMAEN